MSAFFTELWEGIFTPGPTPTILKATNASFAALQIVLLSLLYATYSVHFVVLSGLCAGLWWSINWFARELRIAQAAEEEQKKKQGAASASTSGEKDPKRSILVAGGVVGSSDDSDTEVEGQAVRRGGGRNRRAAAAAAAAARVDVEPVENRGELKQRVESTLSVPETQSSVSTEDEWEKVSESEKDKDK